MEDKTETKYVGLPIWMIENYDNLPDDMPPVHRWNHAFFNGIGHIKVEIGLLEKRIKELEDKINNEG